MKCKNPECDRCLSVGKVMIRSSYTYRFIRLNDCPDCHGTGKKEE